jgi:hypothetical protein
VTKKLAAASAGTAAWVTDVGNEHGQVLTCVLTTAEGAGLADMAAGLVRRYELANQPPPVLIYVDRDCCGGKVHELFPKWRSVQVKASLT